MSNENNKGPNSVNHPKGIDIGDRTAGIEHDRVHESDSPVHSASHSINEKLDLLLKQSQNQGEEIHRINRSVAEAENRIEDIRATLGLAPVPEHSQHIAGRVYLDNLNLRQEALSQEIEQISNSDTQATAGTTEITTLKKTESPKYKKETGTEFLKGKYDLHNKSEVASAAARHNKRTEKEIAKNPEAQIQAYLDRFNEILSRKDPDQRAMGIQALKKVLFSKFIVKPEDIKEGYWKFQKDIAEKSNGKQIASGKEYDEWKERITGRIIADQEASLGEWIDFLSSGDSSYMPDYIKYWTFRSVLDMQQYDKDKEKFPQRSKGTVQLFPEINEEALFYVVDKVIKKHQGIVTSTPTATATLLNSRMDIPTAEVEKLRALLYNDRFADLYEWGYENMPEIPEELLKVTDGEWITYEGVENAPSLAASLNMKSTGWCIVGKKTAEETLAKGPVQIYYSLDAEQKPTVPRIAVALNTKDKFMKGSIEQVRGISYKQNIDPYIIPILEDKLKSVKENPFNAQYLSAMEDTKSLNVIKEKIDNNIPLDNTELDFLYEKNRPIRGFIHGTDNAHYKDIRLIDTLVAKRDFESDIQKVFGCDLTQVAHTPEEIHESTKLYVGKLTFPNAKNILKDIPHIYTRFPGGYVDKENFILIGGYAVGEKI